MKKKGFTLIELLAVIVILAIIALIATPLVLKYIEKSRKESKVDSAYSFVRNLETEIANYSIKNNGKKYNGQPTDKGYYELSSFKDSEIDTTVKGDKPNTIKVCLSSLGQVEKAMFEYGKYYVSYDGKKGSISDKDTYDNFSCSGNVAGGGTGDNSGGSDNGSNSGETIISKQEIEFVIEDGESIAMLDSCLDTSLFEYGKYYNVVLTDKNGNSYDNMLIAQNSILGVNSVDSPYSFVLLNTEEVLGYRDFPNFGLCAFVNVMDSNEEFKYTGKYEFSIVEINKTTETNYVGRFNVQPGSDIINSFEFYSSDLKVGDEVTIEVLTPLSDKTVHKYEEIVGSEYNDVGKKIYDKKYYKYVSSSINFTLKEPMDVNVIINGGEKVYNFKKDDFKYANVTGGLGCVWGEMYYIGNNDIDHVDSC